MSRYALWTLRCALVAAPLKVASACWPLAAPPAAPPRGDAPPLPGAHGGALRGAALWWRASDRLIRDVAVAVAVLVDYRLHARDDEGWERCHERGAAALLRLCSVNAGVYIKLGQHVAQMPYLLPRAYVETLAVLTHAAPADGWPAVCAVLDEELPDWRERFSSLEEAPIASASLAQVHVGVLAATGARVAVKVQHAGLRETVAADLATLRLVSWLARTLFPADYDLNWLADEVSRNVPLELDFRAEAANMAHAGAAFAHRGAAVAVPRAALPPSPRLLVMSFETGCYANARREIAAAGLAPRDVARLVAEVFAEQIFETGVVHADPHAANMLVRPRPGAPRQPQLVLLDHGLYREVAPALRLEYAALWRGIVLGDEAAIARSAAALGCAGSHRLWASMLTARRWASIMRGGAVAAAARTPVEDARRVAADARHYAPEIVRVLRAMPPNLLLLLKTNDNLRTVDLALGTPINTLAVTARYTQRALNAERWRTARGALGALRAAAANLLETAEMELHLATLAWLAAFAAWLQRGIAGATPAAR